MGTSTRIFPSWPVPRSKTRARARSIPCPITRTTARPSPRSSWRPSSVWPPARPCTPTTWGTARRKWVRTVRLPACTRRVRLTRRCSLSRQSTMVLTLFRSRATIRTIPRTFGGRWRAPFRRASLSSPRWVTNPPKIPTTRCPCGPGSAVWAPSSRTVR